MLKLKILMKDNMSYLDHAADPAPGPVKRFSHFMARTLFNQPSFKAYLEPFVQLTRPNWQVDGIRCRVMENRRETGKVFTLTLKPESHWQPFEAGQYVDLSLNKNGIRHIRTFSISSSPEDFQRQGTVELTIRIQESGSMTPWMEKQLIPGSRIHISQARGEFVLPTGTLPLLLVAGGSGITPFRSMLRLLASNKDHRAVTLMYFGHEFLFEQELEQLQRIHPDLTVHFIKTRTQGHISEAMLNQLCPEFQFGQTLVCGPHSLIKSTREILREHGVEDRYIRYEYFGAVPIENLEQDGLPDTDLPMVRFAQSNAVVQHQANQSLLELAESAQLKPLHGCRRGVCHQCVCQKNSGVVYNTLTQQYSDTGPEEIQLCVCVPVTPTSIQL